MRMLQRVGAALAWPALLVLPACSPVSPPDPTDSTTVMWIELPAGGYEHLTSSTFLNDWVAAMVSVEGTTREGRMRNSGNATRRDLKKSYKLRMSDRRSAVILSAQQRDRGFVRYRLASYFFEQAGLDCSRLRPLDLYLDTHHVGLYLERECVDSAFFATRDIDIVSLYKVRAGGRLDAGHVMVPQQIFDKKLPDKNASYADLTPLIQLITAGINADNLDQLARRLNIRNALDYYAVTYLVDHRDGTTNNYYLYHDARSGRFHFVPWDLDLTFRHPRTDFPVFDNGLFEALMAIPHCRDYVVARARELLCLDQALQLVDSLAAEVRACYERDPLIQALQWDHSAEVAEVKQYLRTIDTILDSLSQE